MPAIIVTPGAANANSYVTLAEASTYMASRLAIPEWENADDQTALLTMATRLIDVMYSPRRRTIRHADGESYVHVFPTWTGAPASDTQRLAWPRTGMKNRNGVNIPSNTIPIELKEATTELAAQLAAADTTRDNDVITQGITSVKAGSVSVSFREMTEQYVVPTAVINLLVPSWITDEFVEPAMFAEFTVL